MAFELKKKDDNLFSIHRTDDFFNVLAILEYVYPGFSQNLIDVRGNIHVRIHFSHLNHISTS